MRPSLNASEKVILTLATTGGLHGNEAGPALPEQSEEIVADFEASYRGDVTVAHIHVRDRNGRASADPVIYSEVLAGIRERCSGMTTQVGNGVGIARDDHGMPLTFTHAQRMALGGNLRIGFGLACEQVLTGVRGV